MTLRYSIFHKIKLYLINNKEKATDLFQFTNNQYHILLFDFTFVPADVYLLFYSCSAAIFRLNKT